MALSISATTLQSICQALNRPAGPSARTLSWDRHVESGWIAEIDLEDAILLLDPRLDRERLKPGDFAAMLKLAPRAVFARPDSRFDDPSGFDSYAIADSAAILILLERLGFAVDPEPLCALIRPALLQSSHLTWQEVDVLFHDKSAQRTPPLTIGVDSTDWRGMHRTRIKTPRGYRIEFVAGDDGTPLWLTAKAPRYRKRPEPVLTHCQVCGHDWVKGLPEEDKRHRATHRRRLAVLEPQPHTRFLTARDRDALEAAWVDCGSPPWKRDLVYRRAYAFKREMGFDFVQWSIDPIHDFEAVGFLFSDDEGRIVGAACFRPQDGDARAWRLDWIWIASGHRRSGHLSRQWETFRQRFGEFDIEPPVSAAMEAFLGKRGLTHLV